MGTTNKHIDNDQNTALWIWWGKWLQIKKPSRDYMEHRESQEYKSIFCDLCKSFSQRRLPVQSFRGLPDLIALHWKLPELVRQYSPRKVLSRTEIFHLTKIQARWMKQKIEQNGVIACISRVEQKIKMRRKQGIGKNWISTFQYVGVMDQDMKRYWDIQQHGSIFWIFYACYFGANLD